jgi:hypothetical protein
MNPAEDRLIELATRPLAGNAEIQLAAAGELRRRIETCAASPAALDEAADALDRADRRPRRHRWRVALYVATLLVSLPALVHSARQVFVLSGIRSLASPMAASPPKLTALVAGATPAQKLLVYGDPKAVNHASRWKPLWDSSPENPAYFAEYANACYQDSERFSPELLATAERLDPDNGWFPALAAAGDSKGAVSKQKSPRGTGGKTATPVWKIDNEQQFQAALTRIHQAAQKPRFTAYQNELLKQRIPLFPPRTDFVSQLPPTVYLAAQNVPAIHLRKLTDLMAAGAQQCAANQDVSGFRQITGDWQTLAQAITRNGDLLIDLLVAKAFISSPLANFRDAAQALGLTDEAARFSALHEQFAAEKAAREKRRWDSRTTDLATSKGSLLASMTLPMLARLAQSPPPLTEADLRPGRYADHAVFERIASFIGLAILGLCAGLAALQRLRHSPLFNPLAERMLDLLRRSDWWWIIAGGIVAPAVWYFGMTRLTPLSAREWSIRWTVFLQPSCQFGAMVVMMIVLPVVIAAWRLGKRGAPLGLAPRRAKLGMAAAICAVLAVPAFGAILSGPDRIMIAAGIILLGLPVLWLVVGFFVNILGNDAHALHRATLARMVLPAWVSGMFLMAVSMPVHHAQERRWIQQDPLYRISAEKPAPTHYEWEVTQQLRKELVELMDQAL